MLRGDSSPGDGQASCGTGGSPAERREIFARARGKGASGAEIGYERKRKNAPAVTGATHHLPCLSASALAEKLARRSFLSEATRGAEERNGALRESHGLYGPIKDLKGRSGDPQRRRGGDQEAPGVFPEE
jgi:hypothetical protein